MELMGQDECSAMGEFSSGHPLSLEFWTGTALLRSCILRHFNSEPFYLLLCLLSRTGLNTSLMPRDYFWAHCSTAFNIPLLSICAAVPETDWIEVGIVNGTRSTTQVRNTTLRRRACSIERVLKDSLLLDMLLYFCNSIIFYFWKYW